jgi:hypothetical protein
VSTALNNARCAAERAIKKASKSGSAQKRAGAVKAALDLQAAWEIVSNRVRRAGSAALEPVPADLYIADVGPATLLFLPGEISESLGERLKRCAASARGIPPERICLIGYANGHVGYVMGTLPEADPNYEEIMSEFGPQAADALEEAVRRLSIKGMCTTC